jgi:glycosyltransferase involved in cell wall biosynthesis
MLSVVIPARDEEAAIGETILQVRAALDGAKIAHEILVVDDGSLDKTGELARAEGATVLRHPIAGGYGRSLKDGILKARYDLIAILDADGTYPADRLPELYRLVRDEGFDMAVGARTGAQFRGTFPKMPARALFQWLAQYASGARIPDVNSGLRVFRKEIPLRYMHTIGDRFSFTTTITLASLLNGHFVKWIEIPYYPRKGKSHVRYWRDTLVSLQIIVENILYYNPLKLFLLMVNALLLLALVSGGLLFALPPSRADGLLGTTAAFSLVGAFIVAAIGLSADLGRLRVRGREQDR